MALIHFDMSDYFVAPDFVPEAWRATYAGPQVTDQESPDAWLRSLHFLLAVRAEGGRVTAARAGQISMEVGYSTPSAINGWYNGCMQRGPGDTREISPQGYEWIARCGAAIRDMG